MASDFDYSQMEELASKQGFEDFDTDVAVGTSYGKAFERLLEEIEAGLVIDSADISTGNSPGDIAQKRGKSVITVDQSSGRATVGLPDGTTSPMAPFREKMSDINESSLSGGDKIYVGEINTMVRYNGSAFEIVGKATVNGDKDSLPLADNFVNGTEIETTENGLIYEVS